MEIRKLVINCKSRLLKLIVNVMFRVDSVNYSINKHHSKYSKLYKICLVFIKSKIFLVLVPISKFIKLCNNVLFRFYEIYMISFLVGEEIWKFNKITN